MKILHVHKYFHAKDGAGRYLFDLMRLQEAAGHTVAALAMDDPRNAPSAWSKYSISNLDTSTVGGVRSSLRQLGRAAWSLEAKDRMEDMLDAFRPDLVHAHNIYTHLSPSVLAPAKKRGVPVVLTVHDYGLLSANYGLYGKDGPLDVRHRGLLNIARSRFIKGSFAATLALELVNRVQRKLKLVDKSVSRYLAVSQFVKDTMVQFGFDEEKIAVVSPSVPPELFVKEFTHEREDAVLFAGRLERYKGIETYLEAAALAPELRFYVAGTGPLLKEVEAFQKTHENVIYLGFVEPDALWQKIANVRAAIVPSLWYEPFGLAALEPLAIGTPVIASDIGGLSEFVAKSGGGKLFTPGDADALASSIRELFAQGDYEEVAKRGRAYAIREHAPEAFLKKVMTEYARASEAKTSP
jgi:glycosyltransferase involved in cell wall biosynthesis